MEANEKEDRRCNYHCLAIKKAEEFLMKITKKGRVIEKER